MTEFGTLHEDGTYKSPGTVDQAAMLRCPHVIIAFEHYRPDGSCKCDDPAEQARLIREAGYTDADFPGRAKAKAREAPVRRLREAGAARTALVEALAVADRELEAALVAALAAGVSKRAIAREAGVARQTVYNILARQGREKGETT